MEACELDLGKLREASAIGYINLLVRPIGYSTRSVLPSNPRQDQLGDETTKLFLVAEAERIRLAERLPNGSVAGGGTRS